MKKVLTLLGKTRGGGCTLYGGNHAALGAAGGVLAATYLEAPITMTASMMVVGAFGGLLPDCDTKNSFVGRFMPNLWFKIFRRHRMFTHSLLFCAIVFALAFAVQLCGQHAGYWERTADPYIPVALTVGALTHLFGDALTYRGVPFFFPITQRRFTLLGKKLSFKTGSAKEAAVVSLLLSITIAVIAMPYTARFGEMLEIPPLLTVDTGKIIIFLATVVVCLLVLKLYNLNRPRGKSR